MKLVKVLATLAVGSMALAASTTSTMPQTNGSSTSTFNFEKIQKNISLGYLNESVVNVYKADGFYADHLFYPGYKIDKYHTVKLVPYLRTSLTKAQRDQGDAHTQYLNTSLRLYRSKILTQDKHGVNLNFQMRNYFYPKATRDGGKDTAHRLYFTGSKTVGKVDFTAGAFTQINNRNSGSHTAKRGDYLALGAGYNFSDMFSTSATVEYYHAVDKIGADDKEYITITVPAVAINYKKLNFSVGTAFDIIESKDGHTGTAENWVKNGKVIADLYISAF